MKTLLELFNKLGTFKKRGVPVYVVTSDGAQVAYYIKDVDYVPELGAVVIFAGDVARE